MGEFLSRLSSRSRLTWIIALIVFVAGAGVGGYLIYKKQIFAATATTGCTIQLAPGVKITTSNVSEGNPPAYPVGIFLIYNTTTLAADTPFVSNREGQTSVTIPQDNKSAYLYSKDFTTKSNAFDCSGGKTLNITKANLTLSEKAITVALAATQPGNTTAPATTAPSTQQPAGAVCVQYTGDTSNTYYWATDLAGQNAGSGQYNIFPTTNTSQNLGPLDKTKFTTVGNDKCTGATPAVVPGTAPATAPAATGAADCKIKSQSSNATWNVSSSKRVDGAIVWTAGPLSLVTGATNPCPANAPCTTFSKSDDGKSIFIKSSVDQGQYTIPVACDTVSAAPATAAPAAGATTDISGDECYAQTVSGKDVYFAGKTTTNSTTDPTLKIDWSGNPEVQGFSVGAIVHLSANGGSTNHPIKTCVDKQSGATAPATETQANTIQFLFTNHSQPVLNVAVAQFKEDKPLPVPKQSSGNNIVNYPRPTENEKITVRGYKDLKVNNQRVFAKCGPGAVGGLDSLEIDANTPSQIFCKFDEADTPPDFENAAGCYVEADCPGDFSVYTQSDMPKGTSSIYFRAVRYSYAGAGFTEFPQFAPVGGATFSIAFKPITTATKAKTAFNNIFIGTEKALAQTPNPWTGYTCYSINGGKTVARETISGQKGTNDCFFQAVDPRTCKESTFARISTGGSGTYVLADKPTSGYRRYPIGTTLNQGVANPTVADIRNQTGDPDCTATKTQPTTGVAPGAGQPTTDVAASTATGAIGDTDICVGLTPPSDPANIVLFTYNQNNKVTWVKGSYNNLKVGDTYNPYNDFLDANPTVKSLTDCKSAASAAPAAGTQAGTANAGQGIGGGQIPTAVAPWNNRVQPYNPSIWKTLSDTYGNLVGTQRHIYGTIPDNGLQSGIRIEQLPAGLYQIKIEKSGFSSSTFMFDLKDKEQLDLNGLSIAPSGFLKEAPSINGSVVSGNNGKGMVDILAGQFILDKDQRTSLLYAKRSGDFIYYPSYPQVGWLQAGMTPPQKTIYSDQTPGVPIFTTTAGTPWTGVAAGTGGQALEDCKLLLKAQGMTDLQAGVAAAGLIGGIVFKDKTAQNVSKSIAFAAIASAGGSINGTCGGSSYGPNYGYATSPQCCQAGQDCDASPLPKCDATQPIMQTILGSVSNFALSLINK